MKTNLKNQKDNLKHGIHRMLTFFVEPVRIAPPSTNSKNIAYPTIEEIED
ncbi:MAG TPA: hypothetical protein VIK10_08970 [Prolixibacteraceae bacterium]